MMGKSLSSCCHSLSLYMVELARIPRPSFSSPVREGRTCFRSIRNQRKGSEPIRAEILRRSLDAMTRTSRVKLFQKLNRTTCDLNSGRPLLHFDQPYLLAIKIAT